MIVKNISGKKIFVDSKAREPDEEFQAKSSTEIENLIQQVYLQKVKK
jgi:hypothetical protein